MSSTDAFRHRGRNGNSDAGTVQYRHPDSYGERSRHIDLNTDEHADSCGHFQPHSYGYGDLYPDPDRYPDQDR